MVYKLVNEEYNCAPCADLFQQERVMTFNGSASRQTVWIIKGFQKNVSMMMSLPHDTRQQKKTRWPCLVFHSRFPLTFFIIIYTCLAYRYCTCCAPIHLILVITCNVGLGIVSFPNQKLYSPHACWCGKNSQDQFSEPLRIGRKPIYTKRCSQTETTFIDLFKMVHSHHHWFICKHPYVKYE